MPAGALGAKDYSKASTGCDIKEFCNQEGWAVSSLRNKIAIIAGASSSIGYAGAKLLAQEGAKVVIGARRPAEIEALVLEIIAEDGEAVTLAGDSTDESYAKALVRTAVEQFGGLDIAFNNAGVMAPMGATEISLTEWRRTLDTNLTSAFLAAKYQIPARSVLYLASDLSSFTTGSALLVEGGISVNRT